jgi:hypothetical protein
MGVIIRLIRTLTLDLQPKLMHEGGMSTKNVLGF